ncbi:FAA hydrolase family protein [Alginatibacterium sediminis]|uniref:FAA hydrolase family protein n=1 Tax=Alginatibacterium sediminis TaxID=2164068 RepID=A0A420E7H7_9ALTE|nr:fumarylacetoacetate hydrolase family protein [Alginatibacterium sediminis]RKF14359.1 FAA hydrolase family protein [Alginatibacterium sediminis]
MRIVSFETAGEERIGIKADDYVIDLSIAAPELPTTLLELLELDSDLNRLLDGVAANAAIESRIAIEQLNYRPVIAKPGKIICIGRNYAAHAVEGGVAPPEYPEIFLRCSDSLIGHQSPILRPKNSSKLDYEGEIAAVIGKTARHIKAEHGLDYVAGYSLFNDATLRDYQRKSSQWTIGKNFDDTGAFGPEFVSADELPPGMHAVELQTRLNGEVMQNASTADFIFPMAKLIEILSECLTLRPGDVIITGTPAGVGYVRKPPVFMKPGDIIEIEAAGLGTLRNTIEDEQ